MVDMLKDLVEPLSNVFVMASTSKIIYETLQDQKDSVIDIVKEESNKSSVKLVDDYQQSIKAISLP
jgi:hypothetical protein